jgi:hypothetical protein
MKTVNEWRDQIVGKAQETLRPKKVIGLALGERSLLAAEAAAGPLPRVTLLEEFVYPAGLTLQQPAELGAALESFLKQHGFTAKAAVIGLPVRWLLVRRKEVPPSDDATLNDLLRLQAEAEFSTEIKDLVYDFAAGAEPADLPGDASKPAERSVLLMGTQKKHVDSAAALCRAAHLKPLAVTASALAVGEATAASGADMMVLSAGPAGSELSMQNGRAPSAIRYLRAPEPQPPFLSELRRAVSGMTGPGRRDLVLWDGHGGLDATTLGEQLGLRVRSGALTELGVEISQPAAARNGEAPKFAAAVALARSGLDGKRAVDFLHSRLAPPRQLPVPRWAMIAGAAGVIILLYALWCYIDLGNQQAALASLQNTLANTKTQVDEAQAFVSKVSFAQNWHGGQPRYLACLRDLTAAVSDDGQTYATTLSLREITHSASSSSPNAAVNDIRAIAGQMAGRSSDQQRVESLVDRIKRTAGFSNVTLVGTQNAQREREVTFSISFTYVAPLAALGS